MACSRHGEEAASHPPIARSVNARLILGRRSVTASSSHHRSFTPSKLKRSISAHCHHAFFPRFTFQLRINAHHMSSERSAFHQKELIVFQRIRLNATVMAHHILLVNKQYRRRHVPPPHAPFPPPAFAFQSAQSPFLAVVSRRRVWVAGLLFKSNPFTLGTKVTVTPASIRKAEGSQDTTIMFNAMPALHPSSTTNHVCSGWVGYYYQHKNMPVQLPVGEWPNTSLVCHCLPSFSKLLKLLGHPVTSPMLHN